MGPASLHWVSPDHQEVLGCLAKENMCPEELKNIQAWEEGFGQPQLLSLFQ